MTKLIGIGIFGKQVLSVISDSNKESVDEVINHIESNDLIEYITNKYDEYFHTKFDNRIYNNVALNKFYSESGYDSGTAKRMFGTDGGLLLIIDLILHETEEKSVSWEIEI